MKPERNITHLSKTHNLKIGASDQFSDKDEQLLWERFTKGDDQCLVYIYKKYADILYKYGRQFTRRSEFIRDCIQELFYELIDKKSNLSNAQSVKGYLFAALKRKIVRNIKKEEKLLLEQEGFSISLSENSIYITTALDKKDLSIIQEKLNQLPVNQREVILLHFYEGLTYSEIADIMGIKVRSARALTYRALESLQKQLSPHKGSLYFLLMCLTQI